MISAYPASASVWPGDQLVLHVATDQPRFRVRFFRWGDGAVPVLQTGWLKGEAAAARGAGEDWDWPTYAFEIPRDWPSAVYLAQLCLPDAAPLSLGQTDAAALFVVRGQARGALLYKVPLATYHAYNLSGGGCFYVDPPRSDDPPGARLSFRRPGGGIGGETWGAPDHYDRSSARQTFAHWDARFIRWLARKGYTPEFCTDLDIHADPALCRRYRLLLSVGHDEYWSEAMRDHVDAFVAHGGNVAFFSANLCWWRVHLVDDCRAMVCHQGGKQGARDHWWPGTGAARPEDALGGVSYRHGGGWWDGARACAGYRVQQAEHWVFDGTGLLRGDLLGADTWPPLVGYECDGVPLSHVDADTGVAHIAASAGETGTPAGFVLLAAGLLNDRWQELPAREGWGAGEGIHAAAMGIFSRADADGEVGAATAARLARDAAFGGEDGGGAQFPRGPLSTGAASIDAGAPREAHVNDADRTAFKGARGDVLDDTTATTSVAPTACMNDAVAKASAALTDTVSNDAISRASTAPGETCFNDGNSTAATSPGETGFSEATSTASTAPTEAGFNDAISTEPTAPKEPGFNDGTSAAPAWPTGAGLNDATSTAAAAPAGACSNDSSPTASVAPPDTGVRDAACSEFTAPRGTVFTAGTTDWAQVLDGGRDERVSTITRNVIDRLLFGRTGA